MLRLQKCGRGFLYPCLKFKRLHWIGRFRDFGEDTMTILGSGSDAVISYEKNVLGKEKIKECYYSVAFTGKGA